MAGKISFSLGLNATRRILMIRLKIIHPLARDNIKWLFEQSFRKALGFNSIDRLITIGHSWLALSASLMNNRVQIVPVVMIKRKVYEIVKQYPRAGWSTSFLNSIWYWLEKPICFF